MIIILQAEGQSIKENVLLQRKREKVGRKYTQSSDRGRQLSPGFLEEALDEVSFLSHFTVINIRNKTSMWSRKDE